MTIKEIKKTLNRYLIYGKRIGIFATALTVIGYFSSYSAGISTRYQAARNTVTAASNYTMQGGMGNYEQIPAIETLTQYCDNWWQGSAIQPVMDTLLGKCVSLKSVQMPRVDLGGLSARATDLTYTNLSCSNLTKSDLTRARLTGADLHGSDLRGANLRGADFRAANLRLAKISYAYFDTDSKIDPVKLKCACIHHYDDGVPHIQPGTPDDIAEILKTLKPCPPVSTNVCEPTFMDSWTCAK
jgi:Pentapeptide repeats (8 copies)